MSPTYKAIISLTTIPRGNEKPDSRQFTLSASDKYLIIGRQSKRLEPHPASTYYDCPVMSRDHAQLRASADEMAVSIRDFGPKDDSGFRSGSMHGTYINGTKLYDDKWHPVENGDVISLGTHVNTTNGPFPPQDVKFKCYWELELAEGRNVQAKVSPSTFTVPYGFDDDSDSVAGDEEALPLVDASKSRDVPSSSSKDVVELMVEPMAKKPEHSQLVTPPLEVIELWDSRDGTPTPRKPSGIRSIEITASSSKAPRASQSDIETLSRTRRNEKGKAKENVIIVDSSDEGPEEVPIRKAKPTKFKTPTSRENGDAQSRTVQSASDNFPSEPLHSASQVHVLDSNQSAYSDRRTRNSPLPYIDRDWDDDADGWDDDEKSFDGTDLAFLPEINRDIDKITNENNYSDFDLEEEEEAGANDWTPRCIPRAQHKKGDESPAEETRSAIVLNAAPNPAYVTPIPANTHRSNVHDLLVNEGPALGSTNLLPSKQPAGVRAPSPSDVAFARVNSASRGYTDGPFATTTSGGTIRPIPTSFDFIAEGSFISRDHYTDLSLPSAQISKNRPVNAEPTFLVSQAPDRTNYSDRGTSIEWDCSPSYGHHSIAEEPVPSNEQRYEVEERAMFDLNARLHSLVEDNRKMLERKRKAEQMDDWSSFDYNSRDAQASSVQAESFYGSEGVDYEPRSDGDEEEDYEPNYESEVERHPSASVQHDTSNGANDAQARAEEVAALADSLSSVQDAHEAGDSARATTQAEDHRPMKRVKTHHGTADHKSLLRRLMPGKTFWAGALAATAGITGGLVALIASTPESVREEVMRELS